LPEDYTDFSLIAELADTIDEIKKQSVKSKKLTYV